MEGADMFTGIIAAVGTVAELEPVGKAMRLRINAGGLELNDVALGDSIAVSGPCLTVVAFDTNSFEVDVSDETLNCTSLGQLRAGDGVNLEKALRFDSRLGGHLVSGHIDGIGTLRTLEARGEYLGLAIAAPRELARYMAFKGSVCLDGVSLTVNTVDDDSFEVLTIPHTLERTTLGQLTVGNVVNIEVDLIARYIERLLTQADNSEAGGLSLSALVAAGMAGNRR
jgi:riboflavin synthase